MSGTFFYRINKDDVKELHQSSPSCRLQRPSLIGYYECNYENILLGKRIKYFHYPNSLSFPIRLEEKRLDNIVHKIHPSKPPQRLQLPLYYAMCNANATNATTTECNKSLTTVYGGCRALRQIMHCYWFKYDVDVAISRYNGSLFIAGQIPLEDDQQISHNYRLNHLLFKDSPHDTETKPIDLNIFFSALYRTTIGNYDLIYSAEVQGIKANEEFEKFDDLDALNQLDFVFLKQMIKGQKKELKCLWWYLQSYLSNVEDIYLATKTVKGTISKPLKHIKVSDLPKHCQHWWKPHQCFGLLAEFLKNVEQLMANVNSLDTVYEFHFNAKQKKFYYNAYEGKTEKSFIPQTYAEFVFNK